MSGSKGSGPRNGRVFISYSRKDKEFVRKLHEGLVGSEIETWVDWEGIPLSADWWAEIKGAIEGADAVVYVISPDSLNSKVCGDELERPLPTTSASFPCSTATRKKKTLCTPKLRRRTGFICAHKTIMWPRCHS